VYGGKIFKKNLKNMHKQQKYIIIGGRERGRNKNIIEFE